MKVDEGHDLASLARVPSDSQRGRKVLAGAAFWSVGASALSQLLSLAGNVVVARYLVPEQYGLAGMALVVVHFAAVFSTFGLTPAVISGRIITPIAIRSAHWLVSAIGLLLSGAIVAVSPLVGVFFSEPGVVPVLVVAGLAPLLQTGGMIPAALLQNRNRFDLLARIRVGTQVLGTSTAIAMAMLGYGVWALVIPMLAAAALQTLLTHVFSPLFFSPAFALSSLRGHLREGAHVTGSALGDYAFHSSDKLIVGRMLGTYELGLYNFAYTILARTLLMLSGSLAAPLLASLSGLRGDMLRFDRSAVRACCAVARVTLPVTLGAAAVAPVLVPAVFGPHWADSTNIVRWFLVLGAGQSIGSLVGPIWLAVGESRLLFRWAIAANLGSVLVYFIGATLGSAESVMICFTVFSFGVLTPASIYVTRRHAGVPLAGLGSGLFHVLFDSLAMVAIVLGVGAGLADRPGTFVLAAQVAVGVVAYGVLFRVRREDELRSLIELLPARWGDEAIRRLGLGHGVS